MRADEIEIVGRLIGLPYAPCGRSHAGVDCYGLVLLGLAALGLPLPPDPLVDGRSLPGRVRAFREGREAWAPSEPKTGAVALLGGAAPHHAGLCIAGGILDIRSGSTSVWSRRPALFRGASYYEWTSHGHD